MHGSVSHKKNRPFCTFHVDRFGLQCIYAIFPQPEGLEHGLLLQAHERFPHQATLHCYHFCRIVPSGHGCRKTALHQFVQGSLKHEALSHTFT